MGRRCNVHGFKHDRGDIALFKKRLEVKPAIYNQYKKCYSKHDR